MHQRALLVRHPGQDCASTQLTDYRLFRGQTSDFRSQIGLLVHQGALRVRHRALLRPKWRISSFERPFSWVDGPSPFVDWPSRASRGPCRPAKGSSSCIEWPLWHTEGLSVALRLPRRTVLIRDADDGFSRAQAPARSANRLRRWIFARSCATGPAKHPSSASTKRMRVRGLRTTTDLSRASKVISPTYIL